jgi:hypothetical protein
MATTTITVASSSTSDRTDTHGNAMTGDADTVELYDRAIGHLLAFDPEVVALATELASADEPVPMAHALLGYLHLMSTDARDVAVGREAAAAIRAGSANERERQHAEAIDAWAAGDWHGAARRLDDLLQRWPTDLLALMQGHAIDFFVGDAQNLRDRPLRSRLELDPAHPHFGFIEGMAAFGLEEAGHYGQAEAAGLAAVAAHPRDVWAIHAVTHVYEMTGQVDTGIRFLADRIADWGAGNLFTVHNWWHLAVFHLEAGQIDRVLGIYDAEVHPDGAEDVLLEMVDAAALLWRLRLEGRPEEARFARLADTWTSKSQDEPWYAFNDLHATMALVGAGRMDEARSVIARMEQWLGSGQGSNVRMTAEIGLPAARSIVAFAEERYEDVIAELAPIRRVFSHFGGSHAQRDVLQRTLLESALRAGCFDMARGLTAERLGARDTSVYGWSQRARVLRALGDDADAKEADGRADRYRTQFAAAG